MLVKLILTLVPLTQFTLASNANCPRSGPRKVELRTKYESAFGEPNTFVYCNNLVNKGCPESLEDPYAGIYGQQCAIDQARSDDKTVRYNCNSSESINDFQKRAEGKYWKCQMAQA